MAKPLVLVCQGGKCSRAPSHHRLLRSLCKVADVRLVRCQKICHGSVVATCLDGKLEWFERLGPMKVDAAFEKFVITGKRSAIKAKLRRRWLRDRAGKAPR